MNAMRLSSKRGLKSGTRPIPGTEQEGKQPQDEGQVNRGIPDPRNGRYSGFWANESWPDDPQLDGRQRR